MCSKFLNIGYFAQKVKLDENPRLVISKDSAKGLVMVFEAESAEIVTKLRQMLLQLIFLLDLLSLQNKYRLWLTVLLSLQ